MEHYDSLETRAPADREQTLVVAVREQVRQAKEHTSAYGEILADFDPESIVDRSSLAKLPLTRKSDLIRRQSEAPPFGGFTGVGAGEIGAVYQSPGPIYEPRGRGVDYWRFARAFFAAGVRPGDLVHNSFSYHFTPAGAMMEGAAVALGCPVFPAGVGQAELQVRAMADLAPRAYAGTPSFLAILLDKADELALNVSRLTQALVSGEGLPKALQQRFSERGVDVYQAYATADVGLIAYETPAREGLVCEEQVLVEIVRPGTGAVVEPGEVGELVVTAINPVYPLIRLATGDLSAVLPGPSPCGRTNTRIRGWLGRADQSTKVRGMFVHPEQVATVLARHPELRRGRLLITRDGHQDVMELLCESDDHSDALASEIAVSIRDVCKLRGEVRFVEREELPNDGKVIDDRRQHD